MDNSINLDNFFDTDNLDSECLKIHILIDRSIDEFIIKLDDRQQYVKFEKYIRSDGLKAYRFTIYMERTFTSSVDAYPCYPKKKG
jgi:hypothetical protein